MVYLTIQLPNSNVINVNNNNQTEMIFAHIQILVCLSWIARESFCWRVWSNINFSVNVIVLEQPLQWKNDCHGLLLGEPLLAESIWNSQLCLHSLKSHIPISSIN